VIEQFLYILQKFGVMQGFTLCRQEKRPGGASYDIFSGLYLFNRSPAPRDQRQAPFSAWSIPYSMDHFRPYPVQVRPKASLIGKVLSCFSLLFEVLSNVFCQGF